MAKDKQAHVYVYGVIDGWQDSNSNDWGYVNLTSIKNQLQAQSNYNEIVVHIHSEGGMVTEGFAIHDFLKSQGKKIITKIDGVCASIATVVLLAGEERIGTENAKPLIHNPWGMVGGESKDVKKYAEELEELEDEIAEFYAKKTKLSKEEALELMRVETQFTADEALANGLLTKIDSVMRAVALYNPNKNKKMAETAKKENKKKKKEVKGIVNTILKELGIGKKNAKVVTDSTGVEIDFYELEDGATEAVGDKANIEGKAASGEYVMPSGQTYVFESGELKEIKEESGGDDDSDEVQDLKDQLQAEQAKVAKLKKKNKALKNDISEKEEKLKSISKQMKKLEKNLSGSNFDWNPKKKNHKKTTTTRSVFKPVED